METVVLKLQHPGSVADGLVHDRVSETGAACPFYSPATDDVPMLIYFLSTYINVQMHEDSDVSRQIR